MKIGNDEMITDRVNPSTTWGHEDANRIVRATNWLKSATFYYGATNRWVFPGGQYEEGKLYFIVSCRGKRVGDSLGWEYGKASVIYKDSNITITMRMGHNPGFGYQYYLTAQDAEGRSIPVTFLMTKWDDGAIHPDYWGVNDIPTWEEMNELLFQPWYDLTRELGTYDLVGLGWDEWMRTAGEKRPLDCPAANALEKALAIAIDKNTKVAPLYTGAAYTGGFIG